MTSTTFLAPRPIAALMWLFGILAVLAGSLFGQGETTSAIVGLVKDPAGLAISGATVTVTSADNGSKRSLKTDDAGRFNFPQLRPGPYMVRVEAEGFEPPAGQLRDGRPGTEVFGGFRTQGCGGEAGRDNQRRESAGFAGKSEYCHNTEQPDPGDLAECRWRSDLPNSVCAGRPHEHGGQRQRLRGWHQRLRERAVQRPFVSVERLHRRWP